MTNYYYDKYNVLVSYYPDPSWTEASEWVTGQTLVWNNFRWDSTLLRYIGEGNLGERPPVEVWAKYYVHPLGDYVKFFNSVLEGGKDGSTRFRTTTMYRKSSQSRGALVQSDIVLDETYPTNGIQGGYWYVRKGLAFPELGLRINGSIRTAEIGSVRINGALRQIDWMWVKVNGTLKSM
ncbi:hypothetical protein ACIOBL_19610 [Paenibacillus taichungensis]|uniref:hypothetical protein n=1 Tax=Paenibacillus taichungensis TaxID=484184 RepID=UPI00382596E8